MCSIYYISLWMLTWIISWTKVIGNLGKFSFLLLTKKNKKETHSECSGKHRLSNNRINRYFGEDQKCPQSQAEKNLKKSGDHYFCFWKDSWVRLHRLEDLNSTHREGGKRREEGFFFPPLSFKEALYYITSLYVTNMTVLQNKNIWNKSSENCHRTSGLHSQHKTQVVVGWWHVTRCFLTTCNSCVISNIFRIKVMIPEWHKAYITL